MGCCGLEYIEIDYRYIYANIIQVLDEQAQHKSYTEPAKNQNKTKQKLVYLLNCDMLAFCSLVKFYLFEYLNCQLHL